MTKQLDPKIRQWAGWVYRSDPIKYSRLIVWIKAAEKKRYPAEVIAEALRQFYPYRSKKEWWPYLTVLVRKQYGKHCARLHEKEHEKHKAEEKNILLAIYKEAQRKRMDL